MTDPKHGFKTKSSAIIHENPYYRINKHELIRPDGKPGTYWVIDRTDYAVIVPLFPDNTVLLVGQYRYPIQEYLWEFPVGHVDDAQGEAIAKQELEEETGYIAMVWKQLGEFYPSPGLINEKGLIFLAQDLSERKSKPEATEFLAVKRVSLVELAKMIETGTIKDGPTIIAYHFLERYLKQQNDRAENSFKKTYI